MSLRPLPLFLMLFVPITLPLLGQQQTIDFEQFAGSSAFSSVQPPLVVAGATISGGAILRNTNFLPADQTTIYGTASFCTGCLSTITLTFTLGISNVSMLILNGNTVTVTYTVMDDQGGLQTITLVANFNSGAGTVTLPETNIRSVTIEGGPAPGGCCTWDFFIDNITFMPTSATIVDPIPNQSCTGSCLLSGAAVTTDTSLLATQGTVVQNVAADGTTQVVVRIPTGTVGQELTISLTPNVSTSEDGAIASLGNSFGLGPITVTAVSTPSGPMAFAIYRAPSDFSRGGADDQASQRTVSLHITPSGNGGSTSTTTITILRAPVILIHGLWDSASTAWPNFTTLTSDPRFVISEVDYNAPLTGITSSTPTYTTTQLAKATQSALGFGYNAPGVLQQIRQFIDDFKTSQNAAAVQADIVAHSMGGTIVRTLRLTPSFASSDTFQKGSVHKLITIGTPHLGTPLATQLVAANNSCVAGMLADNGHLALSSVTLASGTVTGGVGDLEGDGKGAGLSIALGSLQTSFVIPFPTALVVGVMASSNLTGIDCIFGIHWGVCAAEGIRKSCKTNPLAINLTSTNWPTMLGGQSASDSDAVVPKTSQLNNTSLTSVALQVSGVVHSTGMEQLNFNPPAELDSASIATEVIALLNESLTGVDYHSM